jgi:hypothetical protein
MMTNLQPKVLNFRFIDSEKPAVDFVCAEHKAKRTLEVLPMQNDEFLAQTENFDIIKSSSSTSTDSFFGCEELKFPHDRDLSSRSISAHAEPATPNDSTEILKNDGHVNQENRKRHKKSKKKKNERSKISVKTEDLKDKKIPKVSTNAEIKYVVSGQSVHDRTGKGLMSHNDCPNTLTVRAQSAVRQSYLGKDQNRNLGHNRENFGDEFEDKAHRPKVPSGPKELVLSKGTFTLPQIVSETSEPLHNQSRRAKRTTKDTQQTKTLSIHALCLPPIEKNNFVIAENPMGKHSRGTSHTVENHISPNVTQKVFAKRKSMDNFNNQHWGQSASNRTDSSRLKSSVRRKSGYDRDVLENRAKVPPFDTRCDQEIKVRFPKI